MTDTLTLTVAWTQGDKKIDGFEQHFVSVGRGRFVCLCGAVGSSKKLRSHFWTCETVQWVVFE